VHYAGNAAVWQTANRVQADRIDIDRDRKSIVADGKVVTQFETNRKRRTTRARRVQGRRRSRILRQTAADVYHCQSTAHGYTDEERIAVYTGVSISGVRR